MDKVTGTLEEDILKSDSSLESVAKWTDKDGSTTQSGNSFGQCSSSNPTSNLELSKQTTKDSESPTLVEGKKAKQEEEQEQRLKSKLTKFGKRVVDGYNKKASKTNVPVEMLYRFA